MLNTVLDSSILYTALLPIRSGISLPLTSVQLRYRPYSGFLSPQLRGAPAPLCDHAGHIHPREWRLDAETWLLHAVVSVWRRSRAHRLCPHVYVVIRLIFSQNLIPSANRKIKTLLPQRLRPRPSTDTLS